MAIFVQSLLQLVEPMAEDSEPEDEPDPDDHQDQQQEEAAHSGRATAAHLPLFLRNY